MSRTTDKRQPEQEPVKKSAETVHVSSTCQSALHVASDLSSKSESALHVQPQPEQAKRKYSRWQHPKFDTIVEILYWGEGIPGEEDMVITREIVDGQPTGVVTQRGAETFVATYQPIYVPQPEQGLTLTDEQVRELLKGITPGEWVEVCLSYTPNGKLYYLSAGPMEAAVPVGNFELPDDAPRENLEAIVALPAILTDLHTTKTELSKSQSAYARLWEGLHDVRERCERGENCTPALLIEFIDQIQRREIPNADEVL